MRAYFLLLILSSFACQADPGAAGPDISCSLSSDSQSIVDQLDAGQATPFDWTGGAAPDDQLMPLVDYFRETPIVGMGEATHGTAEFYRFKSQLFRLLVTEAGFKAIVFEIPWGNALVVNDFVRMGTGSAAEAVGQTYYWTYDTQEVIDLVQWMHDYNLGRVAEDQIWFVGCDVQGGGFHTETALITEYLEQVAADSVQGLLANYQRLPTGDLFDYYSASSEQHSFNQAGTERVYQHFLEQADHYVGQTSRLEYEIALMATHLVRERERVYRTSAFGELRDSLMAVYTDWWQRILAAEARVAAWAHNRHVMDASALGTNWMGTYLHQMRGDDYRTLGFSFGRGSFNAFLANASGGFAEPVRRQEIERPSCGTSNALLDEMTGEQSFLIFEQVDGAVATYFRQANPFTQLGAGYNASYPSNYTQNMPLARLYDVLVHFDRTTASVLR